jgi:hypothetical protein
MKLTPKISGEYKISDDLLTIMQENPGKGFRKITIDTRLKDLDTSYVIKALNDSSVCICDSYEDALYINELINKGLINVGRIELKDDLEMKDRSYIDFKQFEKTVLSIPTGYYMWGVKNIDESKLGINQKSINEITRIVQMISEFPERLTDIEKIILLVNYVQHYCEYINSRIDILNKTHEQFELIDNGIDNREVIKKLCHENYNQVGTNIDEPLFENYATCSGFATLMVLLLNNPYIKIAVEHVSSGGHSWNVVPMNGKYYNLDVTRAITYSPYRAKNNLKTLAFNKEYILVGTDFLEQEGHEIRKTPLARPIEESKDDFNHEYLNAAIEHLESTGLVSFEYEDMQLYPRVSSSTR